MGVVYKATDQETEVDYAVKVLAPELTADPQALSDLKKEVANAQALTHQNLLKVNYLASTGSLTYVVMEYIDGENLEEYRLRRGGKLTLDDLRKIGPQILTGLNYLHEKGVVHRDIKPHNIMLTKTGEVKITDYGIASTIKEQVYHRNNTETPTGTLAYMAPEQLRGEVCDRRTDVYAAGLMFQRLLTGRFPFDEKKREAIAKWHLDPKHAIAPTENVALNRVLEKCLEVDPGRRYTTCREVFLGLSQAGLVSGDFAETLAEPRRVELVRGVGDYEKALKQEGPALGVGLGGVLAGWVLLFLISGLTGWLGWFLKAALLGVWISSLIVVVGWLLAPPDRAGRPRRVAYGLAGGGLVALIFAARIGGFFSSFFFALALGLVVLGLVGAKVSRWSQAGWVLVGVASLPSAFFLLLILIFGGPGRDEAARLVGVWQRVGMAESSSDAANLNFTAGGNVTKQGMTSGGQKVGKFQFDGSRLVLTDQDRDSNAYGVEFTSANELLLRADGYGYSYFKGLAGTWQRRSEGGVKEAKKSGEKKKTMGDPDEETAPAVGTAAADPRLFGRWRIAANSQIVEFTKGGTLVYGKTARPYRSPNPKLVEILYPSGNSVDERLTLDFVSNDELVVVNSTTFGELAGISGRLSRYEGIEFKKK